MSPEHRPNQTHWLSTARALVEPSAVSRPLEAQQALICFSGSFYNGLLEALGLGEAPAAPNLVGAMQGKMSAQVVVYLAHFGAPAAGMLLEVLVAAGIQRAWMFGTAGSLSPRCGIGDIVVPTWGVREEGTSYHYLAADVRCQPSPASLSAIRRDLADLPFAEGGVWTCDAAFRETMDKVREYNHQGVVAVEMECTALMAIALYRQIEFGAVLVITDELYHDKWVEGFGSLRVQAGKKLVCERVGRMLQGC